MSDNHRTIGIDNEFMNFIEQSAEERDSGNFYDSDIWLEEMEIVRRNSQDRLGEPFAENPDSQRSLPSSQGSTVSTGHINDIMEVANLMDSSQGRRELQEDIQHLNSTLISDAPWPLSDDERTPNNSQPLALPPPAKVSLKILCSMIISFLKPKDQSFDLILLFLNHF